MPPKTRTRRRLDDAESIAALASAPRLDLLAALRTDAPLSVRELAQRLGRAPTALYHHLQRLQQAGLVVVQGIRRQGRRDEKLYALAAKRLYARPRGAASRAALQQVGAVLLRQMARDHRRALADASVAAEGPQRRVALRLLSLRLDLSALAALNADLDALFERWAAQPPQPAGQPLRVALVVAPSAVDTGP